MKKEKLKGWERFGWFAMGLSNCILSHLFIYTEFKDSKEERHKEIVSCLKPGIVLGYIVVFLAAINFLLEIFLKFMK